MNRVINIISLPWKLLILILAGIVIVIEEEREYRQRKCEMNCPTGHANPIDVVVQAAVTCETVHTICPDCGKVLNERTDC